jgi:hypothetical protein
MPWGTSYPPRSAGGSLCSWKLLRCVISYWSTSGSRPQRLRIEPGDRVLWSWFAQLWPQRREGLRFVYPRAVLEWQKRRFRDHWRRIPPADV